MKSPASDVARAQPHADAVLYRHLIQRAAAGEDVHGREPVFRPRMNRDVRFRNDDDAADAVRAEVVKDFGDDGPVSRAHGIEQQWAKSVRVLKQRRLTTMEFEKRVESEGRSHFRQCSGANPARPASRV